MKAIYSISDNKYKINDWLFDNLGLDADEYTNKIDSQKTVEDILSTINTIKQALETTNSDLAKKFYMHCQKMFVF